jgi:hypothetical protein
MGDFLRLRSFYRAVVAPLMRLGKRVAAAPAARWITHRDRRFDE